MGAITYDKYKKLSIEERSQAFVNRLENFETKAEKEYAMVGYITGATEQRKIDIDKACELYKEEIKQMKCLLNHLSKGAGELIDLERSLEIFKQGMTNQQ